ncbi:MAG: phospholipid carrier-dependent glycosyltransferase [Gemmatimonadetes bacterium]|nr:phospholipid carrier-dependent glycosyltransferase [Gemmatimonadota bacterium]
MNLSLLPASRAILWPLYALIVMIYVLKAGEALQNHVVLAETDTTSYLRVAQQLKLTGGVPGFLRDCLNGTFKETNQHPAYPLVLHPLAEPEPAFFVRAKVISFFFGLVTLISLLWIAKRVAGDPVALLAGALLAMNASFADLTSMVACEAMLALAFLWTVFFLTRESRTRAIDLATGAALAAAYMTKGTGIFLLPVIVAHLAVFHRGQAVRSIALVVVGFAIVASPLLARNTIVYGNPVYNVNTHVMWLDDWETVFSPAFQNSRGRTYSAARYFREHTSGEVRERIATGLDRQTRLVRRMFTEPVLWRAGRAYLPLLALGFVAGVIVSWRRWGLPALLLAGGFFVFFTWYSVITTHARFHLPVVPVVFMTAAWGFWWAARRIFARAGRESLAEPVFVVAAAVVTLLGVRAAYEEKGEWDWKHSYTLPSGYPALRAWMNESFTGDRIMIGPSHTYPIFYTMAAPPKDTGFPLVEDAREIEELMIRRNIRYAVCDREIWERREASLSQLFDWPAGGVLAVREDAAPRWRVEMIDPHDPPAYAVLSFHPSGEGEAHDER